MSIQPTDINKNLLSKNQEKFFENKTKANFYGMPGFLRRLEQIR
jgi:hypothetical protein